MILPSWNVVLFSCLIADWRLVGRYTETEGRGASADTGGEDGAAAATVGSGRCVQRTRATYVLSPGHWGVGHQPHVQGGVVRRTGNVTSGTLDILETYCGTLVPCNLAVPVVHHSGTSSNLTSWHSWCTSFIFTSWELGGSQDNDDVVQLNHQKVPLTHITFWVSCQYTFNYKQRNYMQTLSFSNIHILNRHYHQL